MCCAIPSHRIYWHMAPICAACSCCSGTRISQRRRSIRMFWPSACSVWSKHIIRWREKCNRRSRLRFLSPPLCEWVVDLDLVASQLKAISRRFGVSRNHVSIEKPLDELMLQFRSPGDDCEFGLVQRAAGVEPPGLLRFAGICTEERLERLVAAPDAEFTG